MKEKIKVGYIGIGRRGRSVLGYCVSEMADVEVKTVCDIYEPNYEKLKEVWN